MFLKFVSHDVVNNTLEATWLEEVFDEGGNSTGFASVKVRNYSSEQKAEFLADTNGQKYADMAGW